MLIIMFPGTKMALLPPAPNTSDSYTVFWENKTRKEMLDSTYNHSIKQLMNQSCQKLTAAKNTSRFRLK